MMLHTYFLTRFKTSIVRFQITESPKNRWDIQREVAQILTLLQMSRYVQWLFCTGTVVNFQSYFVCWDKKNDLFCIAFAGVFSILVLYLSKKFWYRDKTILPLSLSYINTRLYFYFCLVTVCVCLDPDGSSTFVTVTVPVVCVCTQQIYEIKTPTRGKNQDKSHGVHCVSVIFR